MTSSFSLVFFLCIAVSSAVAASPWFGVWTYGSRRHSVYVHRGSHRPYDDDGHHHDHDHGYPSSESDQSSDQQPGKKCPHGRRCKDGTSSLDKVRERFSCNCLLKVDSKTVFRQKDPRV
ncbi:uncharacterized protein LOC129223369 isoform X2 [Uloborus diversus]|uniref:uncharacterized protein LOC129223369 isoform X2 n=1 Tax=Uloborus diversus TaxID=327109 RepID=UPI00240A90B1|nr:uncharacterized protein LOC129223369 isoform X2 [Uloborus diversus]